MRKLNDEVKKSGIVTDVDYSRGTIIFKCALSGDILTCTWSGMYNYSSGDFVVASGGSEESFDDASSYEPNSARLVKLTKLTSIFQKFETK